MLLRQRKSNASSEEVEKSESAKQRKFNVDVDDDDSKPSFLGRLFSFFTFSKGEKLTNPYDFEKRLNDLELKIQKVQSRMAETRLAERSTSLYFFIYSVLFMVIGLGWGFIRLYARQQRSASSPSTETSFPFDEVMIFGGTLLVLPISLWFLRRLINWHYGRSISHQEVLLSSLRSKQKVLIEDLKKQTNFYLTKGLLERYSNVAGSPRRETTNATTGFNQNNGRGGGRMPMNSNGNPNPNHINNQFNSNPNHMNGNHLNNNHNNAKKFISHPNLSTSSGTSSSNSNETTRFNVNQPPRINPNTNANNNNQQAYIDNNNNNRRTFWDRVLDLIVGEDPMLSSTNAINNSGKQKFALICKQCNQHNGLVMPEEYFSIKYYCPYCKALNEPPPQPQATSHPTGASDLVIPQHQQQSINQRAFAGRSSFDNISSVPNLPLQMSSISAPISPISREDNNNNGTSPKDREESVSIKASPIDAVKKQDEIEVKSTIISDVPN